MTVEEALKHKRLSRYNAEKRGYKSITVAYRLPYERSMLQKVIDDMERNNGRWSLVGPKRNPEMWRKQPWE